MCETLTQKQTFCVLGKLYETTHQHMFKQFSLIFPHGHLLSGEPPGWGPAGIAPLGDYPSLDILQSSSTQVMNAESWGSYLTRRDAIAEQCRTQSPGKWGGALPSRQNDPCPDRRGGMDVLLYGVTG